jgi:hypothetical protein
MTKKKFGIIKRSRHLKNQNTNRSKGCKRDTMNQHDLFLKRIHVIFPKKKIHTNEFWNNVFVILKIIYAYNFPST